MTYGELQSWPTCNSLTICLRTFSFASTLIICSLLSTWEIFQRGLVPTFLAMTTLVEACMTLLTVPPLPAPSSLRTIRSSLLRSSLNSKPISSVSVRSLSEFPKAPGICESPSDGLAVLGGGALSAKPLTFFLFSVLALNWSDMMLAVSGSRRERFRDAEFAAGPI